MSRFVLGTQPHDELLGSPDAGSARTSQAVRLLAARAAHAIEHRDARARTTAPGVGATCVEAQSGPGHSGPQEQSRAQGSEAGRWTMRRRSCLKTLHIASCFCGMYTANQHQHMDMRFSGSQVFCLRGSLVFRASEHFEEAHRLLRVCRSSVSYFLRWSTASN